MSLALPWYALAIATTLLNGCTLGFIAWREGNASLRSWALAWLSWGSAVAPLAALESPESHPLVAVLCGVLWVVSALLFLRGAYGFAGRELPRVWQIVAALCVAVALVLGVGPAGPAGMVPLVLFQALGLCASGLVVLRAGRPRAGAWLGGIALGALGLHVLDAPLVVAYPELFLWGFALALALQMLAALGMLMLYYEHARTELLEAQRVLDQTRRMEALGRIAGGVAHDFNNLLTVMQGHLDLVRDGRPARQSIDASLTAMDEAVQRATRLTQQLLAFGRRSLIRPAPIDVHTVVADTLELLRNVIPGRIQLAFESAEKSLIASVDQALLEQIVLNLVTNARDAILGEGTIRVELRRVDEPPMRLRIRVSDDGAGIDPEVAGRVFEPFFTTKPPGRGTGLGLASVQGAVSQLGGQIVVESEPGRGTTFQVDLPWTEGQVVPSAGEPPVGSRPLAVLVVDDDDDVRRATTEMLGAGGHRVDQAQDAAAALARVGSAEYDLVIADAVMPGVGGVELCDAIERIRPEMPLLLTSGYPSDGSSTSGARPFLAKPFRQRELLDVVARIAARPSTRS